MQALSVEIEQYVTQALKTISGTKKTNTQLPENTIIPFCFDHEKIVVDNLDQNIIKVLTDFNKQLTDFYYTFSANISAFKEETVLLTTPPRLKENLTEKIQQLIEQSEAYELHKML